MTKFIGKYTLSHPTICDDIIDYFKNNSSKSYAGAIYKDGESMVKKDIKDSTDIAISVGENTLVDAYVNEAQVCLDKYKKDYKYADEEQSLYDIVENISIQYYTPGQAFHKWHCERSCSETSKRHLVFMTYLNDVTDEGETEWAYQQLKIQPKKGLSVIWPSEFTYTHRGIPSKTQEKYIATGWFNLT